MTKKLEELFDLPTAEKTVEPASPPVEDFRAQLQTLDDTIDKIDQALPGVRGLEANDEEMDSLADLAKSSYNDLMDLGMQVDSRFASEIFSVASNMLGHAITAKTAKMDKKLRMVQLQLQKARLDHQVSKDNPEDRPIDGQGIVLDRNALLEQILQKNKNT